jgi:hypothetical protein
MLEFARVTKAGLALAATITAGALIAAVGERAMAQPPADAAAQPAAEPVAFDADACAISVIESLQQHTRGERNGWRDFAAAADRLSAFLDPCDPTEMEPNLWVPATVWTAPAQDPRSAYVRRRLPDVDKIGIFDALEQVASSQRAVLEVGHAHASDVMDALKIGSGRQLSHLAVARFVIAAEREDWNTATASLRMALAVSRSTQQQAMSISVALGRSLQGPFAPGISDALTHVLRTRRVPAPVLERMLAAWNEQAIAIPPEAVVRAETCFGKAYLDSMFIRGGPRDGLVNFRKVVEIDEMIGFPSLDESNWNGGLGFYHVRRLRRMLLPLLDLVPWLFATRSEAFAAIDAGAERAGHWFKQPPYLRVAPFNDNVEWQQMGARGWPIRLALAPGGVFGDLWPGALVERDHLFEATRLILAVELHRARTGSLPVDLTALVPGELASLPTDPMSGQPYRYRVVPPGVDDPAGLGFVVYGVGADLIDDGGRPLPPELRGTTNRKDHAGFDVVYGMPWPAPKS